jgi:uncharacterized repeat protein (TIGR03803 family)
MLVFLVWLAFWAAFSPSPDLFSPGADVATTLLPRRYLVLFAIFALVVCVDSTLVVAQREQTLYSFGVNGISGGDGDYPVSNLIRDSEGNLYGTTEYGGTYGLGTVFELSPPAQKGGAWTETILHSFQGDHADGSTPIAGVAFDRFGNLYGATNIAIYQLVPPATAGALWSESVIYTFQTIGSGTTGLNGAGVAFIKNNLYVVTLNGGDGNGNVLELKPPLVSGDPWRVAEIFVFSGGENGSMPLWGGGALVADPAGNLYGTAMGSEEAPGLVFELSPPFNNIGFWRETVLYSFDLASGAPLTFDKTGNLYGTAAPLTGSGGEVFELSPAGPGGPWSETTLYSFSELRDGFNPYGGLIFDKAGNLYGTTSAGGSSSHCAKNGCGSVFELSPSDSGPEWTETILHSFAGPPNDGLAPFTSPTMDSAGRIFGMTVSGGAFDNSGFGGTVFEITP